MVKQSNNNKFFKVFLILLIFFVLINFGKIFLKQIETFRPPFCNSRDFKFKIEIKVKGDHGSAGKLSKVNFWNSNNKMTDDYSITKHFPKFKTSNTGWHTVPMKSSCKSKNINKVKIKCSDTIKYEWLKIEIKSKDITRTRTFRNGHLSKTNKFYDFSMPLLPLGKKE